MAKSAGVLLKVRKVPFGIIAACCGIAVFFALFGLILAYVISSGIAAQTNNTVSFLEEGWQVLVFVVMIIAAVVGVFSTVMCALKRRALIAARDDKYFEYVPGGEEDGVTADNGSAAATRTDDDLEQGETGAPGFDELYSALPEESRARADAVAAHARSLGETSEKKSGSALTFRLRGKAVLKLRVMRGRAVAAFELENEELREYRRESGAHIARKETRVPLTDDAAVESACKLTDLMAASYERDRERAAERRRERRRAARAAAKGNAEKEDRS